jgi:hypothetical protein
MNPLLIDLPRHAMSAMEAVKIVSTRFLQDFTQGTIIIFRAVAIHPGTQLVIPELIPIVAVIIVVVLHFATAQNTAALVLTVQVTCRNITRAVFTMWPSEAI